jgi:two-component system cell cycle response regulator
VALKSVIVIEPAEVSRERLAERLRMQGFQVIAAPGSAEGAHLALSNPPAAVVANLWMPGISGVQLCRLLKAEPATATVPVLLRGPETQRNRFWAEHAGAAGYVGEGRMGDLVRTLTRAIAATPPGDDFFTEFGHDATNIRDRIASYLDHALFESVIASEVRSLSLCGAFDRLFDLLSQFACQVANYRWLALSTATPLRWGLHTHPDHRVAAEAEARRALELPESAPLILVEDEDARAGAEGPPPLVRPVNFASMPIARLAFAGVDDDGQDAQVVSIIAQELGGPVRMATLVEETQRLATVDVLTGLMNRRALLGALGLEMERSLRLGYPLSLLLLDVDHFKAINDNRGHASGDAVLAALGRVLAREARKTDLVARWGGEEFLVVLVGCDEEKSAIAGERFRRAVEAMEVHDGRGERIPVTASFGLARLELGESVESFVERADKAMYAAKSGGRNRVAAAPSDRKPALARAAVG